MAQCFSWFPSPFNRKLKSPEKSETRRASYDDNRVTPTAGMYMLKGGEALASTLESLSGVIPVPFLADFVKVAGAVLEACDEAIAIEEDVKDLQRRVYSLAMTVIESGAEIVDTNLRTRIENYRSVLNTVLEDLKEIKQQKRWLLIFFHDLNKERVRKCMTRVNVAVEQFELSHELLLQKALEEEYSEVQVEMQKAREAAEDTNKPHTAPVSSRAEMPPQEGILYGRQDFVDSISSLLVGEETSRVCITGPGGMGKTSVARAVMQSATVNAIFAKEYQFWVPCVKAESPDLLRRILYAQLCITADSYDNLAPLIAELRTSKDRRLLLLDNFETPWLSGNDEDQDQVRYILSELAQLPHVALLVTMTSAFPPSSIGWQHRELPALDVEAARDIFKHLYPKVADGPELTELLNAIGYIPLAVTLMAVNGAAGSIPPQELLREWGDLGTEMISPMDHTIGLSVRREIMSSNPEAFKLLSILSMLPAGTNLENLHWWAGSLRSYTLAIKAVRAAALVEGSDTQGTMYFFVRPTIQAYMSHMNRIPAEVQQEVHDACYGFVLNHKSIPDDAKFKHDVVALAGEETNIQSILMKINADSLHPKALDALLAFSRYQLRTKPSIVVASHALKVALAAQESGHISDANVAARHVAEAQQCLGELLVRLDRFEEASLHFEEARRGFKGLIGGSDRFRVGECTMELVECNMYTSNLTFPIGDIHSLALEAQADLSYDSNRKNYVARGFLGLANFLSWQLETVQAREALLAAKEIFEQLDYPASTAECLYHMARLCALHQQYAQALVFARQALEKAEQAGDVHLICRILKNTVRCLIASECYDEAFTFINRALSQTQALGSPLGIAQSLELLGYNWAAKMDLSAARVAYEAAKVQFAYRGSTRIGKEGEARCATNLEKLKAIKTLEESDFFNLTRPQPLC